MKKYVTYNVSVALSFYAILCLIGCSNDRPILAVSASQDLSIIEHLHHIESLINTQHITYNNYPTTFRVDKRWTLPRDAFSVEETYKEIYQSLYDIDQRLQHSTPILYDLKITHNGSDSISFTSTLFLGYDGEDTSISLPVDPCEPFEDDYYIGWEVSLMGPQEKSTYNSRCDGTDTGHSAFQRMSEYMAREIELRQLPLHKGEFVFTNLEYFDLRFENNTFSDHDYKHIVENCIGRSINDFRPDVCVQDYDLNCLYCELMPLIESEVNERILPPNAEIGIFYFYFGYNSTSLDNNSIGYGLCYGVPTYVPPGPHRPYPKKRCFCDETPRTTELFSNF